MMLAYYAMLPRIKNCTEKDRSALKKLSFDPHELVELKLMNTHELKGLMVFCEIRVYEGMPVIACEDDELRLAYLAWRAAYSLEKRSMLAKKIKATEKIKKTLALRWVGNFLEV